MSLVDIAEARAWLATEDITDAHLTADALAKALLEIHDADARLCIESDATVTVIGDGTTPAALFIEPICVDPEHTPSRGGCSCGFVVSPREARVLVARLLAGIEKAEAA